MKGGGGGLHESVRGQSLRTLYKSYHFFSHEKCGSYNRPYRVYAFRAPCHRLWRQLFIVVANERCCRLLVTIHNP
jgi:hypothetical protein